MTFGQKLKQFRRAKSVSQRELAAAVGVDFSYISKIENDKLPPPAADTILKISTALGIDSESLISESGKLPSNIKKMVTNNPEAIRFFNTADNMNLSSEEWRKLIDGLKKLR